MTIGFRPLEPVDLPLVLEWFGREHVRRWWDGGRDEEGVAAEYLEAIEGRDPTDLYLIVLDEQPVGMIETYIVADHPEWQALVRAGPGVAGVDLFIGEEELTGRGFGVEILCAFTRDVVFARAPVRAVVAGIDVENTRSLRAFAKAGFEPVLDFIEDGRQHRLLRLERPPG